MPPKTFPPPSANLGVEIPFANPHALSVSLPTWSDNVGWASGNDEVVKVMSTGYPRFFIHKKIQGVRGLPFSLLVSYRYSCVFISLRIFAWNVWE